MNKERLLNVARALRESPNPGRFTMHFFGYSCNTPACALGHYAARQDLQEEFALTNSGGLGHSDRTPVYNGFLDDVVQEHFGLEADELRDLFAPWGCGGAQTPIKAAEYIEQFVQQKEQQP